MRHKPSKVKVETYTTRFDTHFYFKLCCNSKHTAYLVFNKQVESQLQNFVEREKSDIETNRRSGAFCCVKCPILGHTILFRENEEIESL